MKKYLILSFILSLSNTVKKIRDLSIKERLNLISIVDSFYQKYPDFVSDSKNDIDFFRLWKNTYKIIYPSKTLDLNNIFNAIRIIKQNL